MKDGVSNMSGSLSKIFDMEPVVDLPIDEIKTNAIVANTNTQDEQKEYVKKTMIDMIEKGKNAIIELQMVARASEKSRDYEVLFNGLKSVTEISEKLLSAEVTREKVEEKTVNNTQQNIFVGSTAELSKILKQQKGSV
jgi:hypothetical protein